MNDDTDEPAVPPPSRLVTEQALEESLRFVHVMEVQGRIEQRFVAIEISALVDLLIGKGVISSRELEERRDRARLEQDQRETNILFPKLGPAEDKYKVEAPDIPCDENLALCKGACCRLAFYLAAQDLDERVIKWEYAEPYRIRRREDGYCLHFKPGGGCEKYENRPTVCRVYDCRKDTRIWEDYEKRIPSERVRKLLPLAR